MSAPASARANAIALPIPLVLPVTKAVCRCKEKIESICGAIILPVDDEYLLYLAKNEGFSAISMAGHSAKTLLDPSLRFSRLERREPGQMIWTLRRVLSKSLPDLDARMLV